MASRTIQATTLSELVAAVRIAPGGSTRQVPVSQGWDFQRDAQTFHGNPEADGGLPAAQVPLAPIIVPLEAGGSSTPPCQPGGALFAPCGPAQTPSGVLCKRCRGNMLCRNGQCCPAPRPGVLAVGQPCSQNCPCPRVGMPGGGFVQLQCVNGRCCWPSGAAAWTSGIIPYGGTTRQPYNPKTEGTTVWVDGFAFNGGPELEKLGSTQPCRGGGCQCPAGETCRRMLRPVQLDPQKTSPWVDMTPTKWASLGCVPVGSCPKAPDGKSFVGTCVDCHVACSCRPASNLAMPC